jgi:hypothetical protein
MYELLVVDLVLNHEAFIRYIQILFTPAFLGFDFSRMVLFALPGLYYDARSDLGNGSESN